MQQFKYVPVNLDDKVRIAFTDTPTSIHVFDLIPIQDGWRVESDVLPNISLPLMTAEEAISMLEKICNTMYTGHTISYDGVYDENHIYTNLSAFV